VGAGTRTRGEVGASPSLHLGASESANMSKSFTLAAPRNKPPCPDPMGGTK
jgi:hypothetical protein